MLEEKDIASGSIVLIHVPINIKLNTSQREDCRNTYNRDIAKTTEILFLRKPNIINMEIREDNAIPSEIRRMVRKQKL